MGKEVYRLPRLGFCDARIANAHGMSCNCCSDRVSCKNKQGTGICRTVRSLQSNQELFFSRLETLIASP